MEDVLRDALRRILLNPELRTVFDEPDKRDEFLDDLTFKNRVWPSQAEESNDGAP